MRPGTSFTDYLASEEALEDAHRWMTDDRLLELYAADAASSDGYQRWLKGLAVDQAERAAKTEREEVGL